MSNMYFSVSTCIFHCLPLLRSMSTEPTQKRHTIVAVHRQFADRVLFWPICVSPLTSSNNKIPIQNVCKENGRKKKRYRKSTFPHHHRFPVELNTNLFRQNNNKE